MLGSRTLALPFLLAFLTVSAAAQVQTAPPAAPALPTAASATTTVVVVRHAEKATDDPRDPSLSPAGQARAQALAAALADAGVSAVFTTELKRTWLTADPVVKRGNLPVQKRPVSGGDVPAQARDLAREILARHAGQTVLVVGHSNTVPEIVKALSGDAVPPIDDSEYDHLFVVTVPASGEGSVIQARYGLGPSGRSE